MLNLEFINERIFGISSKTRFFKQFFLLFFFHFSKHFALYSSLQISVWRNQMRVRRSVTSSVTDSERVSEWKWDMDMICAYSKLSRKYICCKELYFYHIFIISIPFYFHVYRLPNVAYYWFCYCSVGCSSTLVLL